MDKATFIIEDIFKIPGRGMVVTGRVQNGEIRPGMKGTINGKNVEIVSIQAYNVELSVAKEGESCGLLLRGLYEEDKKNIQPGDLILFG